MRASTRMRWAVAACAVLIALRASAQEPETPTPPDAPPPESQPPAAEDVPPPKPKWPIGDPPVHRWGGLTISVDAWGPELANQDDDVAVIEDGVDPRVIEMPADAPTRLHWRVWYHLPNDLGSIRFEYDSMRHESDVEILDPGNFLYYGLLTTPGFAGLSDDGLSDGLSASATTKVRDFRVEYERVVFDSPRAAGSFHVGYRTVDHSHEFEAEYYSLLPAFPSFLPPNFPEDYNPSFLFPIPDSARETSDFSGSGLGAGFDVEFKLHPRVSLWGDLSVGILKGRIDTRYESATSYYVEAIDGALHYRTFEEVVAIIESDGPAPDDNPTDRISQVSVESGLGLRNRSRMAYEFDLSMGVEFKIWRSLAMTAGLRELVYVDIGAEARIGPTGELQETSRTVGYEGFFLGMSYRF